LFLVVIPFSSIRRSTFQKISDFSRDSLRLAESKPNSRMTRMKMNGITLMDEKSPGRGWRAEFRGEDLERRTRRKRSRLRPEQLSLCSRYFLKLSKIDISQKREISFCML